MSTFAERLRQLRLENLLTQDELSKIIGVSKSSINMYERGEREPGFETMETIADYFNVDMDYLYGRSDCKSKAKLEFDNIFRDPQVTREVAEYALFHPSKGMSVDLNQIPESERGMVKKAVDFFTTFMEMSDTERQEVINYAKYVAQKEKEPEID